MAADELQDLKAPQFHIIANLSTDDPRWRMKGVVSVLLAAAAGAGARRADGSARLAVAAVGLLLPALSLVSMIGLALLFKRLWSPHAAEISASAPNAPCARPPAGRD